MEHREPAKGPKINGISTLAVILYQKLCVLDNPFCTKVTVRKSSAKLASTQKEHFKSNLYLRRESWQDSGLTMNFMEETNINEFSSLNDGQKCRAERTFGLEA